MFLWIYLSIFVFLEDARGESFCMQGFRVHTPRSGPDVCLQCEDGVNFISEHRHTKRECHPCKKITDPVLEITAFKCNITQDSEILCNHGYYRHKARNVDDKDECLKCRECASLCRECATPALECGAYEDTLCCLPNYDAFQTSYGDYICKERPVVCGPGQYLTKVSDECLPCPEGTYMSSLKHTYTHCLKCEVLSGDATTNAVIIRSCNRTASTLFSCKSGYYRDPLTESLQIETKCSPCQSCNFTKIECNMFHDAVCGQQEPTSLVTDAENRTVSDNDGLKDSQITGEQSDKHQRKLEHGNYKSDKYVANAMNHNNLATDLHENSEGNKNEKHEEKTSPSDNTVDTENLTKRRTNIIIILSVIAGSTEGFLILIFCVLSSCCIYCTRGKNVLLFLCSSEDNDYFMQTLVMMLQVVFSFIVFVTLQLDAFSNNVISYILIWSFLGAVTIVNIVIVTKMRKYLFKTPKRVTHAGRKEENIIQYDEDNANKMQHNLLENRQKCLSGDIYVSAERRLFISEYQ
uniref:TNFR-Cys domain-containing protein n=1 Tax=Arion vulgaris TaxID=1028688 RepID=A0A0B7ALA0_9EUPU